MCIIYHCTFNNFVVSLWSADSTNSCRRKGSSQFHDGRGKVERYQLVNVWLSKFGQHWRFGIVLVLILQSKYIIHCNNGIGTPQPLGIQGHLLRFGIWTLKSYSKTPNFSGGMRSDWMSREVFCFAFPGTTPNSKGGFNHGRPVSDGGPVVCKTWGTTGGLRWNPANLPKGCCC